MKIKSIYSKSVELAMQKARADFGEETVLVTSRRTPPDKMHLGEYEVVFGLMSEDDVTPTSASEANSVSQELKLLRRQMDDIRRQIASKGPTEEQPPLAHVCKAMLANGFSPELTRELTDSADARWREQSILVRTPQLLEDFVRDELRRRLKISGELGSSLEPGQKTILFSGPAGVGKTTVLAKIAVMKCLAERRSVRIISVDTHRVATHSRLQAYARLIGVGFTAASNLNELNDTLAEPRNKDFLLIDTPGFSRGDEGAALELAEALRRVPNREVHLVLPACTTAGNLANMAQRFEIFQPNYLVFSKLDETSSFGSLVAESLRQNRPLSYLSTGAGIPEDLQRPHPDLLLKDLIQNEADKQELSAA